MTNSSFYCQEEPALGTLGALGEYGSAGLARLEAHIEQQVWHALFVEVGSFVDLKAHVLIEAFCLWVLLVYCQAADTVVFYPELDEALAEALAALLSCDEEHLKRTIFNSHKSDSTSRLIGHDNQVSNTFQCLRNIGFDGLDFVIRQE